MFRTDRKLLVLDFDVEARPMHWIGRDYVSKEIMAIAAKFVGQRRVHVWTLDDGAVGMLEGFKELYDRAEMVTGHYIRGYDLPLVNGMLTEHQLPHLSDKLAQDTKLDLLKRSGLSSSQENLAADFDLDHPKVGMTQADWREAARFTPQGIAAMRERVIVDVEQHIELRQRLLDLGYLSSPKIWRSNAHGYSPHYSA